MGSVPHPAVKHDTHTHDTHDTYMTHDDTHTHTPRTELRTPQLVVEVANDGEHNSECMLSDRGPQITHFLFARAFGLF